MLEHCRRQGQLVGRERKQEFSPPELAYRIEPSRLLVAGFHEKVVDYPAEYSLNRFTVDLNTGKLLWSVPLGEYPELAARGTPKTGTENYGGAIVTAGGLLFCSGTRDSKIRAFDKDNGAELWSGTLPWVGSAPPTTYLINGRQYVVIASTGNKLGKANEFGDAYVAFALPENKSTTDEYR